MKTIICILIIFCLLPIIPGSQGETKTVYGISSFDYRDGTSDKVNDYTGDGYGDNSCMYVKRGGACGFEFDDFSTCQVSLWFRGRKDHNEMSITIKNSDTRSYVSLTVKVTGKWHTKLTVKDSNSESVGFGGGIGVDTKVVASQEFGIAGRDSWVKVYFEITVQRNLAGQASKMKFDAEIGQAGKHISGSLDNRQGDNIQTTARSFDKIEFSAPESVEYAVFFDNVDVVVGTESGPPVNVDVPIVDDIVDGIVEGEVNIDGGSGGSGTVVFLFVVVVVAAFYFDLIPSFSGKGRKSVGRRR